MGLYTIIMVSLFIHNQYVYFDHALYESIWTLIGVWERTFLEMDGR